MKMHKLVLFLFVSVFVSACGSSLRSASFEDKENGGEDWLLEYDKTSAELQSASQGSPVKPLNLDASGLTDDEVVEAFIERALAGLEDLKERHEELKASGANVPNVDFAKLEEGLNKLIEKLQSDEGLRQRFIAQLRNPPQAPDLSTLGQAGFPAELCARLKDRLASETVPEAIRKLMQADYDRGCKNQ